LSQFDSVIDEVNEKSAKRAPARVDDNFFPRMYNGAVPRPHFAVRRDGFDRV
jgi:hypothetical protein